MIFKPSPITAQTLAPDVLEKDKRECRRFGPCGLGKEALYLGGRYLERRFYIPWGSVRRVFKRVAMSSGGFSGRGVFGSMAYLVVQYDGGERQCYFKREPEVDSMLDRIALTHPSIPVHSAEAEKRLAEAAAAEAARYREDLSPEAEGTLHRLRKAKAYLLERETLSDTLSAAARQKRIVDNMKPSLRAAGIVLLALSIAAALYGAYGLLVRNGYGMYFLLGGAVFFMFTLSTNILPSRYTSKKAAQADWDAALDALRTYLSGFGAFPVPPQYAHPVVLERMIRVVREGRAETAETALETVKADLRALNASVKVSQQEYDEVRTVKPLFLVCDYRDTP